MRHNDIGFPTVNRRIYCQIFDIQSDLVIFVSALEFVLFHAFLENCQLVWTKCDKVYQSFAASETVYLEIYVKTLVTNASKVGLDWRYQEQKKTGNNHLFSMVSKKFHECSGWWKMIGQMMVWKCLPSYEAFLVFFSSSILEQGQKVNLPHLVMSQFQWLDRIINGKVMFKWA